MIAPDVPETAVVFTVIIATCGRPERLEKTLQKTVEAIEASGQPHRIVVADNHPDYTSQDVVNAFCGKPGPKVSYLRTPPRDKTKALNAGIRVADTQWLAFTDDDTLPDLGWLREASAFAGTAGYRVFAGQIVSDEVGRLLPSWLTPGRSGRIPLIGGAIVKYAPMPQSGRLRSVDQVPYGANVFVRHDVFEDFGGYDEVLWQLCGQAALGVEDGEFGIRLRKAGEPIGYCREAMVVHPVHWERCKLGIQLKLAFYYGWRDPIVFFHPHSPLLEGYRFRLLAGYLLSALRNTWRRDSAAATADVILFARCWGSIVSRVSPAYRKRARTSLLIDRVVEPCAHTCHEGFACPSCGSEALILGGDTFTCTLCARQYAVKYGIPVFTETDGFYWGELPRERMQALLESSQGLEKGLLDLLEGTEEKLAGYLRHYALDPARAGWKYIMALPQQGVALDFGCGWGSMTLSLADSMRKVYAVDLVPERVAATVRRAHEAGYSGVSGCVSGSIPHLPFPDRMFDLVVINGVMEWVPEAFPGNPRHLQLQFLREVNRVLKPSGQAYIGIENRFGAHYFRGKREEHTKLRFISLMPRWVARAYHRLVLHRPYRAYTYGQRYLTSMIRAAGFQHVKLYCPYPDYREFFRIIDLYDKLWFDGSFQPHSRAGRLAFTVARQLPGLRRFVDSLGVVATRQRPVESALDRFTGHLIASGVLPGGSRVECYRVTRTAAVQVIFGPGEHHIATLPLEATSRKRIMRSVVTRRAIMALEAVRRSGVSTLCVPVISGEFEGTVYKLETFSRGSPFPANGDSIRFYDVCLEWLATLHRFTRHEKPYQLVEIDLPGLADASDTLLAAMPGDTRDAWSHCLLEMQADHGVAHAVVHGDYHRNNILWDGDQRIDRVIDWDLAVLSGLPAWDVLTLFSVDAFQGKETWAEAYLKAARTCLDRQAIDGAMGTYLDAIGLRRRDVWCAILTFPMLQLRHKLAGVERRKNVIMDGLLPVFAALVAEADEEMRRIP